MSGDGDVPPAGQTFAGMLNGLSFSGRHALLPGDPLPEESAAIVRAYAWTGGRTRSEFQLEIETLVSTSLRTWGLIDSLRTEYQYVAQLCRESKSVAEVSALLSLPLGVVRVLLGDMACLGLIDVHLNPAINSDKPGVELLERVLNGLVNLPAGPVW